MVNTHMQTFFPECSTPNDVVALLRAPVADLTDEQIARQIAFYEMLGELGHVDHGGEREESLRLLRTGAEYRKAGLHLN